MEKPVISSLQNLSISYECALAIGNSLNLSEMLHEVIRTIVHKTNAHRGIIWVKNGEQELQPVASTGINIEDVPAQNEIMDLRNVFNQIQKSRQFVLRHKDDEDFLQYCPGITGKEESVLIVPVTNVAILHLVYADRQIADNPLSNLLAGLSKKLSIAIEACMAYENIIKEIQVRKKAEKELTKKTEQLIFSEEKYRTIYYSSRDAIMTLTPEEGFFSGNPAAIEIFGCKDEKEFTSRTPYDLSPQYQPDGKLSSEKAKQMMAIAMEKGSHFFEWTHARMDGKEFPTTVLLTRMKLQGRRVLQATVRDITKRKAAEGKIHNKTDKLEKFNKLAVGRELKMIELKKEINTLLGKLGEKPEYKIVGDA